MDVSEQTVATSASQLVCTNRKNPKPDLNLGWAKCQTLRYRVWHCPNIACNDAFENHVTVCSAIFRIPKRVLVLPTLGSAFFTQNGDSNIYLPDNPLTFAFVCSVVTSLCTQFSLLCYYVVPSL